MSLLCIVSKGERTQRWELTLGGSIYQNQLDCVSVDIHVRHNLQGDRALLTHF